MVAAASPISGPEAFERDLLAKVGDEVTKSCDKEQRLTKNLGWKLGKCQEELTSSKKREASAKAPAFMQVKRLLAPQVSSLYHILMMLSV